MAYDPHDARYAACAGHPVRAPRRRGIATLEIRGARVVLGRDLARLFRVETRRLNERLRRNLSRFDGYAFQLTESELAALMSQIAISNTGRGGTRKRPWAFTEHGVVMAATILKSEAAITAMRLVVEVVVAARRVGELPAAATGLGPPLQRTLSAVVRDGLRGWLATPKELVETWLNASASSTDLSD